MTGAMIDTENRSSVVGGRRRRGLALTVVVAGLLIWGGWDWWARQSYRAAIAEIDKEMAAGKFGAAARNLEKLLTWNANSDEAAYLLGICEQARGRKDEAATAWARVAPGSAFAHRAILARMRLLYDDGQCARAEQLINDAADDPRNDKTDLRVLLVPIFAQLGRIDEAQRLLRERWHALNSAGEGASEQALNLVLLHIELRLKPNPVENVRAYLGKAGNLAPDDDRVWLGQANLAIRAGNYDLARRYLDACLRRRPQDVAVWRALLNWGIAAGRVEVVKQALQHIPETESNPDEQNGQAAEAAVLVGKKGEIELLQSRYQRLFDRRQPIRDAEEMARLAAQLGHRFEARAFGTVALAEEPDREDLRRDLERLGQSHTTDAQHK